MLQIPLVSIPQLAETPPSDRTKGNTSEYAALTLGAWDVRTLTDNAAADRPMRRTVLVANELSRCTVQIDTLSETRRAGEGQLNAIGAGYTFFWSGRNANE